MGTPILKCQEASRASAMSYIPCGAPAEHSVQSEVDRRAYNMCGPCADHSVRNRGMKLDGPPTRDNRDIKVDPSAMLVSAAAVSDALPPAEAVYDYSGFDDAPAAEGDLGMLSNLAEQQRHHEEEVVRLQRELKLEQDRLKDIAEYKIPELMDKVGMAKFSTRNGLNIALRETIRASMGTGPAKERNTDWLIDNGHEAVVKMAVEVPFGRSEADREAAKALAAQLREQGLPANFARKVEPATLASLIRELLEEGRPVPEEAFGVFRQRVAKIS